MAAELKSGVVAGLDDRQAQALRQAGIDTLEKLAEADPEALARKTGLSADDLRRFKTQAAALIQRAPARAPRRSMARAYTMLALIVIAVIAILYARHVRSSTHAQLADQEQKLVLATARTATIALAHVDAAARNAAAANWSVGQDELTQVVEEINFLEQIAPRSLEGSVRRARSQLGDAQNAVGKRDQSATDRIKDLRATMSELAKAKAG